jgi:signal transduction histidine kinase
MEEIVDLRARELSRKALQLEVAAEVSSKIATILDPRGLMRDVAELIQTRFKVYFVEILLIEEQEGILRSGNEKRNVQPIKISETSTSVIAWVARSGEPLYVPDVNEEPRYRRCPNIPASQCELAIPLKFGGKAIGVLNLEADHRDAFPKDEIAVLESLANEIAVSMHNAQVFDALQNANRDLAQATMQAKQANMLKSRFLLNASHKLRTPLNAIIGYSETMLSGVYGDFSETVIDRQQRILENGRHLLELIEDMFDLSSIESGNVELRLDAVAIKPLLEEVINASRAVMQTGYPDHQLNLRLDIADTLPPLWADLDRTRYILINLMSNAVKFTPSGEVTLSAVSENDQIVIRVKDTGPGIPDDELAVLFEPFQQERGSTASEGKGTGLGLPVSRMLAQLQGGDLTVETKLNQGSTFTLRLPCRKS